MKCEELANRLAEYISLRIAPSMTDARTIFVAASAGSQLGRRVIMNKIKPMFDLLANEEGDIDPNELRELVVAGMEKAHKLPVMMGLVTVSKADVDEFFSTI